MRSESFKLKVAARRIAHIASKYGVSVCEHMSVCRDSVFENMKQVYNVSWGDSVFVYLCFIIVWLSIIVFDSSLTMRPCLRDIAWSDTTPFLCFRKSFYCTIKYRKWCLFLQKHKITYYSKLWLCWFRGRTKQTCAQNKMSQTSTEGGFSHRDMDVQSSGIILRWEFQVPGERDLEVVTQLWGCK